MRVRLGVVAPAGLGGRFEAVAAKLLGVELELLEYEADEEIASGVADLAQYVDAICFAGELPLQRASEVLPPHLPVTAARLRGGEVMTSLVRAWQQVGVVSPFSIDSVSEDVLDELVVQAQLPADAFSSFESGVEVPTQEIVDFHVRERAERGTKFVITGRSAVHAQLREVLDVPVFRMLATSSSIRQAMREAALLGVSRRRGDSQNGCAVFRIVGTTGTYEHESQRLTLVKSLRDARGFEDAWIEYSSVTGNTLVFAHQSALRLLTADWESGAFVADLETRSGARLAVGIGLGSTPRGSVELAEVATERAVRDAGGLYVAADDGLVIGPLDGRTPPADAIGSRLSERVVEAARESGLNPTQIRQLLLLQRELRGDVTTSRRVADVLRVSSSSARRVIQQLVRAGLAERSDVKHQDRPGRPMTTYRLVIGDLRQRKDGLQ